MEQELWVEIDTFENYAMRKIIILTAKENYDKLK